MKPNIVMEDIYIFSSNKYFNVNTTIIISNNECIVIDPGAYLDEAHNIYKFIISKKAVIKYIIYTHSHFDHVNGGSVFRGATYIASKEFNNVIKENAYNIEDNYTIFDKTIQIALPHIEVENIYEMYLGKEKLLLLRMPGHSNDSIIILIGNRKLAIVGDTVNDIPYISWGNINCLIDSLTQLKNMDLEYLILGHYGFLFGNKIKEKINCNINYLKMIHSDVIESITHIREDFNGVHIIFGNIFDVNEYLPNEPNKIFISALHKKNILSLYSNYFKQLRHKCKILVSTDKVYNPDNNQQNISTQK